MGPEDTHTHEEYKAMTRKVQEADELANKRVAAAMAQVDFCVELHASPSCSAGLPNGCVSVCIQNISHISSLFETVSMSFCAYLVSYINCLADAG